MSSPAPSAGRDSAGGDLVALRPARLERQGRYAVGSTRSSSPVAGSTGLGWHGLVFTASISLREVSRASGPPRRAEAAECCRRPRRTAGSRCVDASRSVVNKATCASARGGRLHRAARLLRDALWLPTASNRPPPRMSRSKSSSVPANQPASGDRSRGRCATRWPGCVGGTGSSSQPRAVQPASRRAVMNPRCQLGVPALQCSTVATTRSNECTAALASATPLRSAAGLLR